MSFSDTEEPDPLRGIPGSESSIYYFENRIAFDAVFPGDAVRNLKRAGDALGIVFTIRDTAVKVAADSTEKCAAGMSFLSQLSAMQQLRGNSLDERDFNQILTASVNSGNGEKKQIPLQDYFSERIKVGSHKREIAARTPNQLSYVRAMREKDLVFGVGPAGTGKTYLAMAMAVSALLSGKQERIILTRPAVEAGESLGFLPGKLEEKINPYLRPLYDALYDMLDFSEAEALIERNIIEVAPLAFMRGRTLNHAFIILDEAQNTTHEQMLMFLTRLGFGSTCVVCGDPSQIDLPHRKGSGLLQALDRLTDIEDIAVCRFQPQDVVRHSLVEKIIQAYQKHEDTHQTEGILQNEN